MANVRYHHTELPVKLCLLVLITLLANDSVANPIIRNKRVFHGFSYTAY